MARVRAPELQGAGGWLGAAAPLTLAGLRGRFVLLDFWTSRCVNCLHVLAEVHHPVLDDPGLLTWSQYAVRAWPTLVLVDPEGYVVHAASGEGHGEGLGALLAQLVTSTTRRARCGGAGPPGCRRRRRPPRCASRPACWPSRTAASWCSTPPTISSSC